MKIPWAYYYFSLFCLLLGRPYASLSACLRGIQLSSVDQMLENSLHRLGRFTPTQRSLRGYEWIQKLLILARAVKFQDQASLTQLQDLASKKALPIIAPVVIVAGGTSVDFEIDKNQLLMMEGFQNFQGTVISGGTTAGISGIVGSLQAAYPSSLESIGYIPKSLSSGVPIDLRYHQIRTTHGESFSALEPLQYWIDIITSGIPANDVKLIGINGGQISAFEYRLALMLGGSVSVIENSGREASRLGKDLFWRKSKNLTLLSMDQVKIVPFLK